MALAIMALGMGALLAAASSGLGNARAARDYVEATRLAQSHLAALGVVIPLAAGVQSGDDGQGFSWVVRVSQPQPHLGPTVQGQQPLWLYTVEASVSWHSGASQRTVTLQSQRLANHG